MMQNKNNSSYYSGTVKKAVVGMVTYFERAAEIEIEIVNIFCEGKHFGNFYKIFLNAAFLYFTAKSNLPPEDGFDGIIDQVYERIEKIPIRVLVEDINKQRVEGNLFGENTQDEYLYYQTVLLNDTAYVIKLCDKYPVMKELILHQIYQFVEYLREIEEAISGDREIIIRKFCNGKSFQKVSNIQLNLSDSHRNGKTVAKIVLDNGCSIIYKPHSLKKELLFNEIYQFFMENSNLTFRCLNVTDRTKYGWEEYIETKECNAEDEIKRYYERMGVILFICYLFGVTDIHCENIIACGEYPILIDLETMPGTVLNNPAYTAEEYANKKIRHSVLRTGILPTVVWGKNGGGVILSALGNAGKVMTPFQLPYLKKPFTSEVHISYLKKSMDVKGSMPVFQGKEIGASAYAVQICRGFEVSYRLYMRFFKKIEKLNQAVLEQRGRFIIRHTQQYSMYQNISFYPQFLKNWESRYEFFDSLKQLKKYTQLYQYEKWALQKMDIPIFEADIIHGKVYDGEGREYCLDSFIPDKSFYQRKRICEKDLQYQIKCMELSLDMLTERRLPEIIHKKEEMVLSKERIIRNTANNLCDSAVILGEDITWDNIVYYDDNTWKLAPMGLELYDGLAGIAVFFASLCKTCLTEKYQKIFKLTCNKLFAYTDQNRDFIQGTQTNNSGLLKGEGSILYAYLLLYKITGEQKFFFYAEKHYMHFEKVLLQYENVDYLSGSAGAVIVLVKMYAETNHRKYLDAAAFLGEKIWERVKKQTYGYGIEREDGGLPLAGMAHGTSGYLMAYAYLLENVNEIKYRNRIEELLAYENSLYNSENSNWKDLRKAEEESQYTTAWCHGAPGIAIARMKLSGMEAFAENQTVREDIFHCLHALEENKKDNSICLCHGLAGNLWIRNILSKWCGSNEGKVGQRKSEELLKRMSNPLNILPRERYNFSLMTGVTGIGLLLNDEKLCRDIFL